MNITYEVSYNEPLHRNPEIASRFHEVGLSNCEFGCKIYGDTLSAVKVLAHNSNYGCRKIVD